MTEHKPLGKPRRWQDELNEDIDLESWNRQGFYLAKEKDDAVKGLKKELRKFSKAYINAKKGGFITEPMYQSLNRIVDEWFGGK